MFQKDARWSKKQGLLAFFLLLLLSFAAQGQDSTETRPLPTVAEPDEPQTRSVVEPTEYVEFVEDELARNRLPRAPKDDPELLLALVDNPFALVRNGSPRYSKSLALFSTGGSVSNNRTETTPTEAATEPEPFVDTNEPFDTSTAALDRQNPFALVGTAADRKASTRIAKIRLNPNAGTGVRNTEEKRRLLFDTSKVDVNEDGTLKFTVLLVLLALLSYIVAKFRTELQDIYPAFINQNLMALLHRNRESVLSLPYLLLYLLSIGTIGTMTFLAVRALGINILKSETLSLLLCVGGVGGYFLFRHVVLFLLSSIFGLGKILNLYAFMTAIFTFVLGIILLPLTAFLAFNPELDTFLLYLSIGIAGGIYSYLIFRTLLFSRGYLLNNKFHFFTYLCTIEIAPILIFLKLVGF